MDTRLIEEAVKKSIQIHIEKEFDKVMAEVNSRKNEIVAGILIDVMKMVNIEQRGESMIFTIKEIKA